MGSGDYAQPETAAPAAAQVPSDTEAAAAPAVTASTDTQVAVATAVEKVASAVKQKTDALQSEVSAQQAIINDLEHKVAQQTRASVRTSAATQARGRDAEPKPKLGSFEMAKFANNLGTGTAIVDVYDDFKTKADYAGVANRGGQLRSPKDFAAVREEVERQVRGQAASSEARKVAQDIAQVSHEAKEVGGPVVAKQALAAVKHAMKAEDAHEQATAKAEAVAASGDLPPALDEDTDKYVLPAADLNSDSHLIRRLAAAAAPVDKSKLTAITRRALNRMEQSSGEGAEMI